MKSVKSLLFPLLLITSIFISNNAFALNKIYEPAGNAIAGNPAGSITMVEFFDYNCGYCRRIAPQVNQLISHNHTLRLVYREYPVLSSRSLLPAQAALAAQLQGKYLAMHNALMMASSPLYLTEINSLAKNIGLDTVKLDQDMKSDKVNNQIKNNMEIGSALNIQGVPSFIIVRTTPPSHQKAHVLVGPTIQDVKADIARASQK